MACYTHRDNESIGVCKSCCKGLCDECVVDLGFAVTCKGACEETAKVIRGLNLRAIAINAAQRKNGYIIPILVFGFGSMTMAYSLSESFSFNSVVALGGGFSFFGGYLFFIQRRLMKAMDSLSDDGSSK